MLATNSEFLIHIWPKLWLLLDKINQSLKGYFIRLQKYTDQKNWVSCKYAISSEILIKWCYLTVQGDEIVECDGNEFKPSPETTTCVPIPSAALVDSIFNINPIPAGLFWGEGRLKPPPPSLFAILPWDLGKGGLPNVSRQICQWPTYFWNVEIVFKLCC